MNIGRHIDVLISTFLAAAFGFVLWQFTTWIAPRVELPALGFGTNARIHRQWGDLLVGSLPLGPNQRTVESVLILDYACVTCSSQHEYIMERIRSGELSSMAVRLLPDPTSVPSIQAALAAICSARQNAFSSANLVLLEDEAVDSGFDWKGLMRSVEGIDADHMAMCMADPLSLEILRTASVRLGELVAGSRPPLLLSREEGMQQIEAGTTEALRAP